MKNKIIRITTVPQSLNGLLTGQLKFMSQNGFEVVGVSSPGLALANVKEKEGVRVKAIPMSRKITPLQDLKSLWKLYRFFKREKPEIVHSHTPKAGTLGMIAAYMAGVPHRLHTVAGLPLMEARGSKRIILDGVEKLTYACATNVYPNSKGLFDFILSQNYTRPQKLKIIGYGSSNGIDTSRFNPTLISEEKKKKLREELGIAPSDFVFLFVGRIVADKGLHELVEAFTSLNKKGNQNPQSFSASHLVIVGNYEKELDPLKPNVEKQINEHPYIHAVGYKTNVEEYFGMANVLTFPSYREGFPNVVMQAASMQLNAVVSDINGCNEIIEDGYNGWVVPAKNVKQLQEKMQWCIENRVDSVNMGLKSRQRMIDKYERSFVWQKLLEEYYHLLADLK